MTKEQTTQDLKQQLDQELIEKVKNEMVVTLSTSSQEQGISPAALARHIGLDRSAIGRYFKKERGITIDNLILLADALGYDLKLVKKDEQAE